MKKLLFLLLLLALPLTASAQVSDMLLSSDGALYTISAETPEVESGSEAAWHLVLTERRGEQTTREIVPATTVRGRHYNAVLGYDGASGTLFVFWIQHFGYLYNQLLFCTRDRDGKWSEATDFGSPYNYRENLRIAITAKTADLDDNTIKPGLAVHATWWEFDSQTGVESAQYRMLAIENGRVVNVENVDLGAFVDRTVIRADDIDAAAIDPAVLKHSILVPSPQQESVLVVFADIETRAFTKVRITPSRGIAANGRLRVPVGRAEGGFNAPRLALGTNSQMDGIFGGSNGTAALYTLENNVLRYVLLTADKWTETRSVAIDETVTSSAAVNALRRMVTEQ